MDSQTQQCSRCKKTKSIDAFVRKDKKVRKSCSDCSIKRKKTYNYVKCIHGKRKSEKCQMYECSKICIHKKLKICCKTCMTPEKRIKYIKKAMIYASRHTDKSKNIYDANNFIDMCFLDGLFEDYNKCIYCKVEFTYIEMCSSMVTIERKDNSIGHTKANCVLACYYCNVSHRGQKH